MSTANSGNDHGMYVWRDPRRNGYPIGESDIPKMIQFAKQAEIKRILYDNWGTGLTSRKPNWDLASGRQPDDFLTALISAAHDEDILVRHFILIIQDFKKLQNSMEITLKSLMQHE